MRLPSEEGFTLIELLTAVAIMAVIISAVGLTFITAIDTTDDTNRRLQLSSDAVFSSAFLVSDLQSMSGNFSTSGGPVCGSGTLVFNLERFLQERDPSTSVTQTATVSYVLEAPSDQRKRLVRKYCNPPSGSPSDTVIANHVGQSAPLLECDPSCSGTPNLITITITDCARNIDNSCDLTDPLFTYQLKGSRRTR